MGRKAIGIELKESYYRQGLENMKAAEKRWIEVRQKTLFDEISVSDSMD